MSCGESVPSVRRTADFGGAAKSAAAECLLSCAIPRGRPRAMRADGDDRAKLLGAFFFLGAG